MKVKLPRLPRRRCAAFVRERVPGCRPPVVHSRPCKRHALAGSRYCRTHQEWEA